MSHSPSSVCPACFSWQQGCRPAPVCWELIDSASSLAKGPAMVLSPCPACSRAGGVGRDTRSSGKMEVWLEGTDWKRREGGGGGGGLEWKREFGRGWTAARERQTCMRGDPASTHCHRQPQPQIIHPEGLKWSSVASQHSSVPRSAGSDICGMQCSQNPIFGFSFHHQWNGIWWIWYKEEIWVCVYPAAQNQFCKTHWRLINVEQITVSPRSERRSLTTTFRVTLWCFCFVFSRKYTKTTLLYNITLLQ